MPSVTAVVVSCNEGHLLERCLASLRFCDRVVVVDLESSDNTREVATRMGAEVIAHPRVNHVEHIHAKLRSLVSDRWVLLMDPDEEITVGLQAQLSELLRTDRLEGVGQIFAPWQFFFGNRRLTGTRWGGRNRKDFLVNLDGVDLSGIVHQGRSLLPEFRAIEIPVDDSGSNVVNHYWMTGYKPLIAKHRRYLNGEGIAMKATGATYSRALQWQSSYRAFKECFSWQRGYRDGLTGLFLSLFWSWYTYMKWQALRDLETSSGSK